MNFYEFEEAVENYYAKYFTGICDVRFVKGLGKMVTVDCYLASNKSEFPNGYPVNDMFKCSFSIYLDDSMTKEDTLDGAVYEMESGSHMVLTKAPDRYVAYGRESIPFRKVKGDYSKFAKALDKFFAKLHDTVLNLESEGMIANNFVQLVEKNML